MENATKALLIAGSVLIAIVLIAVGLKILSSTSGTVDQVQKVGTTMETSIFNSQYTQYAGNIKGAELRTLLEKVLINNKRGNKNIKIYLGDIAEFKWCTEHITGTEINTTISETKPGKTYNVSITEYDDEGYISEISIDNEK